MPIAVKAVSKQEYQEWAEAKTNPKETPKIEAPIEQTGNKVKIHGQTPNKSVIQG